MTAASTPAPPPQETIRRRTRVTPWSILLPVIGLLAGMLFAGSSSVASNAGRSGATSLTDLIAADTRTNADLTRQLGALQAQVDGLDKTIASGDGVAAKLHEQGDVLARAAGRTAVHGPAVRVSLDDSPLRGDQIPKGMTVDDVVVHQQDVQGVVNALWRGGAEAMMLMDQRVISTSAVRCVGNTLILQGRVYSPPFIITAIGDPATMRQALDSDATVGTYRQYVTAVGLGYDVQSLTDASFPAYEGSIAMTYARTAP